MRVLILSQYYDPEPLPRPVEVAEELTRRGHDVTVLTGLPNYPSGRLASGYRLWPYRKERIRGIPVIRVLEIPYHGPSAARRILNYGSFAISAALAAFTLRRPDAVFVCHPPLTIVIAAWALKRIRGTPFVYDVQDVWPDAVLRSGMMREGRAARILRRLERFAYSHASRIVVVTEGARQNLLAKGVPGEKIVAIPPWPYGAPETAPSAAAIERARVELGGGGRFVVTFAGNIGVVQGLETVVRAAALLAERSEIAFRIVGDGMDRQRLVELAASLGLENIRFLGPRPMAEIPALLAASDACLVHLSAGPLTDLYLPAKTLDYLWAGRPIVMAMTGEAADLVRSYAAGVTVPPDDPEAMAKAMRELVALPVEQRVAMGERGRACVTERFSRERLMTRIEEVLIDAAAPPG